jgi:hypothetical protein
MARRAKIGEKAPKMKSGIFVGLSQRHRAANCKTGSFGRRRVIAMHVLVVVAMRA